MHGRMISNAQKRFHDVSRVIAIDPGRVNIVYAEEKLPDGSFKTYKLTRGQYYETCKFKETNRLSEVDSVAEGSAEVDSVAEGSEEVDEVEVD